MLPDILSVYTKVLSNRCSITFLHDSIHCQHCLNGGIHLVPRFFQSADSEQETAASVPRESPIREARLRGLVIKQDSIPESCFSPMGIKVNETVIAQLKNEHKIPPLSPRTNEQKEKRKAVKRLVKKKILSEDKNNDCKFCEESDSKKCDETNSSKTLKNSLFERFLSSVPILENIKKCRKKVPKKKKEGTSKKTATTKVTKVDKEPTKGTLKRKRWQMQKLREKDEDYEDDIFENAEFSKFEGLFLQDESDSESYEGMVTPKINLSPIRDGSSSPSYNDCYSPTELFITRKEAEEYIYRRTKRRKMKLLKGECGSENPSIVHKNSEEYTTKTLQETCKILEKAIPKEDDYDSDNPEDYYFSDASEKSEKDN